MSLSYVTKKSSQKSIIGNRPRRFTSRETVNEDVKPIIKCQNCKNISTDTTLTLSCKHILCGICLSRHLIHKDFSILSLNKTINIECPICSVGSVSTTLDDIKKMLSETLIVRSQKRKEICSSHQIESEGYCMECKKWICQKCQEQFHNDVFSQHKLISNEPNKKQLCSLHNNTEKDLFCTDCNEEICHLCLRKGEYHYNHFNLTFEDFKKHTIDEKQSFKYKIYERFENVMYELENNFKRNFMDSYNENKKYIEEIENSFKKIKTEYLNKKDEYTAFIENYFQIIKMSYFNFYSDLKEKEPSIITLNFIKSVIKEIDDVKFDSKYKGQFEQMSESLNKIETSQFFKYELTFFNHSLNLIRTFRENKGQIYSITQISNGDLLTAGDDKAINFWDIDNGTLKLSLLEHKKTIYTITQLSNGLIVSGSGDTDIKIWDLNNLEGKRPKDESNTEINKNNKEHSNSNSVNLKDSQNIKEKKTEEIKEEIMEEIKEDNEKNEIVTSMKKDDISSSIGNKYLEDKKKESNIVINHNNINNQNLEKKESIHNSLSKSINKENASQSQEIKTDKPIYKSIYTLRGHTNDVYCVKEINKEKLCSCSKDTLILIWNLKDYTCLQKLQGHTKGVGTILPYSDTILLSGSSDCKINIWNITKENPLTNKLCGHTNGIFALCKLNNGQVISASCDRTLKLWDIDNKNCLNTFIGHQGYVWGVIQLNDTKIASCSSDKSIMIWDIVSFKCINTIQAHKWDITCLCLLKDGKIASGSVDREAKIWEC